MKGNKNVQMSIMQNTIKKRTDSIQINNKENIFKKKGVANKKRNICMLQMLFKT